MPYRYLMLVCGGCYIGTRTAEVAYLMLRCFPKTAQLLNPRTRLP